jgi:predicted short-subunit dehydrogenase-like oxidoreductase (DUF2520 family)
MGPIIHFSGASSFSGLIDAHPLVSFGPQLFSLEFYKKINFVLSDGLLCDFIPELPNHSFQIQKSDKPFYHALCVLSGNFTTMLWQKMFAGLNDLNLPIDIAYPYLGSIVENLKNNPEAALTGPLARKDFGTIRKNLESLQNDPYQKIYRAFQQVALNEVEL